MLTSLLNRFSLQGGQIRNFTVGLIGVAAIAAGMFFIRQHRQVEGPQLRDVPPGENVPAQISLERLRELGY